MMPEPREPRLGSATAARRNSRRTGASDSLRSMPPFEVYYHSPADEFHEYRRGAADDAHSRYARSHATLYYSIDISYVGRRGHNYCAILKASVTMECKKFASHLIGI